MVDLLTRRIRMTYRLLTTIIISGLTCKQVPCCLVPSIPPTIPQIIESDSWTGYTTWPTLRQAISELADVATEIDIQADCEDERGR